MGNQGYTQSLMMQTRIPILHLMERMANHQCNMGTLHVFWKWWRDHTPRILMPIPPINEPAIMPNKEIPTITFTFPEEELVEPHILVQTTPYICPAQSLPPTLLQHTTWKASMMFRGALPSEEIFIAPLSWWPPVRLSHIPFQLIFPLSKTLPQSSPIIHLGQQIQCIASYINLVDKMLYDSAEPRRYRYLPDSEMWYDSILKLKWNLTFNFDYPENTYKSEDEQPQNPNQLWTWMFYCYKGTSSHITYAKIISKHPQDTKTLLLSLPTAKNMLVFIGPFARRITNMDFPETTTTTAHSTIKLGKKWPDLSLPYLVQPNMSQHIA